MEKRRCKVMLSPDPTGDLRRVVENTDKAGLRVNALVGGTLPKWAPEESPITEDLRRSGVQIAGPRRAKRQGAGGTDLRATHRHGT